MANAKRDSKFGRPILVVGLLGLGLAMSASAASRSATTTVAVRVERHVGLVLPTGNGLAYASLGSDLTPAEPTAFGNGSSRVVVSRPSEARFRPASNQSSGARVEVTVFEP